MGYDQRRDRQGIFVAGKAAGGCGGDHVRLPAALPCVWAEKGGAVRMRIGLKFAKEGAAAFISHLDLQRAFSRAIRRAGLPVKMSQGFNPHYVMSFASALAVGTQSRCECVEFAMGEDIAPDVFLRRIGAVLPPGLKAVEARRLSNKAPKMMAAMRAAEYAVFLADSDLGKINASICDIIADKEVFADKRSKGGIKKTDIRPMIFALELCGDTLHMRLASGPSGSLKPELVLAVIEKRSNELKYRIVRTRLLVMKDGNAVDLLDALSDS